MIVISISTLKVGLSKFLIHSIRFVTRWLFLSLRGVNRRNNPQTWRLLRFARNDTTVSMCFPSLAKRAITAPKHLTGAFLLVLWYCFKDLLSPEWSKSCVARKVCLNRLWRPYSNSVSCWERGKKRTCRRYGRDIFHPDFGDRTRRRAWDCPSYAKCVQHLPVTKMRDFEDGSKK